MKSGLDIPISLPRYFQGAAALLFGLLLLPGCSNVYSEAIEYGVRTDPIFKDKLGTTYDDPDRPGQLPIDNYKDMADPRNPFYAARDVNSDDPFESIRKVTIDPNKASAEDREAIRTTLESLFGRPAHPRVDVAGIQKGLEVLGRQDVPAEAAEKAIRELKLDEETLARGSQFYRVQCLQCHGVPGNGRGPTAKWVNPHPRDYRMGIFKFMSVDQVKNQTENGEPRLPMPTRDDLHHTLYTGVENTSMPAFNLLPEEELEALVSYVIHLSIRGQTEIETFKALAAGTAADLGLDNTMKVQAAFLLSQWYIAPKYKIEAAEYPYQEKDLENSIRRGQAMFLGSPALLKQVFPEETFKKLYPEHLKKRNNDYNEAIAKFAESVSCASCHTNYGTRAQYKFDSWGTLVKARSLLNGTFRGGRRPIDIYYRIHSGINGSGMAAFGTVIEGGQIWDLVNFIRTLPYEQRRQALDLRLYPPEA